MHSFFKGRILAVDLDGVLLDEKSGNPLLIPAFPVEAVITARIEADREKVESWLKFGQKKVTLQVPHESDLLSLQNICANKRIANVIVHNEQQIPCILVLGPDLEKVLDPITGKLRLF